MGFYIHVQETPNPDAVKFISQYTVKGEGKSNYREAADAAANPLAEKLFAVDGVKQLFFFDNYITVTRSPGADWEKLVDTILDMLQRELPQHNPNYVDDEVVPEDEQIELTPEVEQINEILDRTVRPYLASDGGGIKVLRRVGNHVFVKYMGACGSCPSSIGGTLSAIQNILRDEVDPNIEVIEITQGASAY
jgi:Fe-S cluster biogenesis protein NfuA